MVNNKIKTFLNGSLMGGLFFIFLLFVFSVNSTGTHFSTEIISGTFGSGDFTFLGSLTLNDNRSIASEGKVRWNGTDFETYVGASGWVQLGETQCEDNSDPSGIMIFYNGTSCPSGYSAVEAMRGRYLVALVSGGTLENTVGTALTNSEDREVGRHNHGDSFSVSSGGSHSHGGLGLRAGGSSSAASGGGSCGYSNTNTGSAGSHGHSISGSISNEGTTDSTNAPYIQYLIFLFPPQLQIVQALV